MSTKRAKLWGFFNYSQRGVWDKPFLWGRLDFAPESRDVGRANVETDDP